MNRASFFSSRSRSALRSPLRAAVRDGPSTNRPKPAATGFLGSGRICTAPSPVSRTTTFAPGRSPIWARNPAGMTTWPLVDVLTTFMMAPSAQTFNVSPQSITQPVPIKNPLPMFDLSAYPRLPFGKSHFEGFFAVASGGRLLRSPNVKPLARARARDGQRGRGVRRRPPRRGAGTGRG